MNRLSILFFILISISYCYGNENENIKKNSLQGFTFLGTETYSCNKNTYTVKEYKHKKTGMEFVLIPAGSFMMGGTKSWNSKPVHEVKVGSFLMSKTEVTQGVWEDVMKTTPWKNYTNIKEGKNYAATYMLWNEAKIFCHKIGLDFPTEAEWEYACRSGSNDAYYWGNYMDLSYAWRMENTNYNGEDYAHKVGQKKPNAFGLHDMSGNVGEYCADWFEFAYYEHSSNNNPKGPEKGSMRVIRGGAWNEYDENSSCSYSRNAEEIAVRGCTGIRLCIKIDAIGLQKIENIEAELAKLQKTINLKITSPENKCKVGIGFKLAVEAIRGSGEIYNPEVLWSAKYGTITDDGFYTAPMKDCEDIIQVTLVDDKKVQGKCIIIVEKKKEKKESKKIIAEEFVYMQTKIYSCNGNSYTVKEYKHKKTGMEFVQIPAGSFVMGEKGTEEAHNVELGSFLMSKTEVTQGVWKKIMETTPWKGKDFTKEGKNYAATYLSWNDSKAFCDKVELALPTEAQWEYACKSGSDGDYYWGEKIDKNHAWYYWNTDPVNENYAHEVGQKKTNAFGLHDMLGNVFEWCADWHSGDYYSNSPSHDPKGPTSGFFRIIRGGSWSSGSGNCSSCDRPSVSPDEQRKDLGFRLCLKID